MRMKDVCERTGLTDRAVRLYIENGLVSPIEEKNYAGRRTLVFGEEDIKTLEAVATLRRSDFSISDIAAMQSDPESISDIVKSHRAKMAEDIKNKQEILCSLESCASRKIDDYFGVAEAIRCSASRNSIPKEDSGMNLKEFKEIIIRRSFGIFALVFFAVGFLNTAGLAFKTAFADVQISHGGGYELEYGFSAAAFGEHAVILSAVFALLLASVLSTVYLIKGKKSRKVFLVFAAVFGVVSAVMLLAAPSADAERMYFFEFLTARGFLINLPFYRPSEAWDFVIKLFKYIPIAAGITFSVIAYCQRVEKRAGK